MLNAYINGFLDGICIPIAVEQTKCRVGSEEVIRRNDYMKRTYYITLLSMWNTIVEGNSPDTFERAHTRVAGFVRDDIVVDHASLASIIGIIIGTATALYTPVIVNSKLAAIDMRFGEMWMAQPLEMIDGHVHLAGDEVLLSAIPLDEQRLVQLRWATDDEPEDYACLIRGHGLPSGFAVPAVDLSPLRNAFKE